MLDMMLFSAGIGAFGGLIGGAILGALAVMKMNRGDKADAG
jgi:hypothetical protein